MAEYGEWSLKGATLSDVTAKKEFGVDHEFIIKGIEAGKLEYRHGAVWGNPYIRLLRRQLEQYIAEERDAGRLSATVMQTELRKIKREIAKLEQRLTELKGRKAELEQGLKPAPRKPPPPRK
jgi:flagellar motility protein MotE (MotC chaperone)